MPAVNTTSYPKLIKALREALGTEKLLTVTVYEEPTATFWDTEATGGIAVGDYIDYAWSGYNSNSEAPQLLDPWHPELEYVSTYTQKPIAQGSVRLHQLSHLSCCPNGRRGHDAGA